MGKEILILGAGFGGLEAASILRERLDDSHRITLIDKNDHFIIGFSKFEVMFGRRTAGQVKAYYADLAHDGVEFIRDTIETIDPERRTVTTRSASFGYDHLIVGLGAELVPEATPGFVEGGYEFYSLAGAERLYPVLDGFTAGTILLSVFGKPYKCPPAPFEAAFQLHDFFTAKGVRDDIELRRARIEEILTRTDGGRADGTQRPLDGNIPPREPAAEPYYLRRGVEERLKARGDVIWR